MSEPTEAGKASELPGQRLPLSHRLLTSARSAPGLIIAIAIIWLIFVIATEVNVVKARRLWPRALTGPLGAADRKAIALSMQREALTAPDELESPPRTPPESVVE